MQVKRKKLWSFNRLKVMESAKARWPSTWSLPTERWRTKPTKALRTECIDASQIRAAT